MKVAVINDCAHVMETLIPFLQEDFDIDFVQRTRRLFSKTAGLLFRVACTNADLYHVSYGLQDAWLVQTLKHLNVLHVHGSDVRQGLHNKWRRIVKSNLEKADKVLYSTPDLKAELKGLRDDAQYLPTPINLDRYPLKEKVNNRLQYLYFQKSYDYLDGQLQLAIEASGGELHVLEPTIPYENLPRILCQYDVFIDQQTIPAHSRTCLEALACGLSTLDYRHWDHELDRIQELTPAQVYNERGLNRGFVLQFHNAESIAKQLKGIWES